MRIIRGKYKTRRYTVPKGFPSRPTTDFAKEGLFNVLENQCVLDDLNILDLCAGTGNISIEFLSREAGRVTAVDQNFACVKHIRKMAVDYDCAADLNIIRSEMVKYLNTTQETYDLIFADPPFAYTDYQLVIDAVFKHELLEENGWLILEHGPRISFEDRTQFHFLRKYGNVHFSFFKYPEVE